VLLNGKVAIVTGASRGLGKAISKRFAEEGAVVVMCDINGETLEQAVIELQKISPTVDSFLTDVTDESQIDSMVQSVISKYKTIDILVNNAGISSEMPLVDMPMEIWDQIINVNLRSVALCIKSVLPIMIDNNSGNVVNISSAAALRGLPGSCAYSASKAAVLCLSQSLGDEVRPNGIRVNAVCPGPIDTELFRKSEKRQFILDAGGDVFEPETIANGVLFLASDLSKGTSSQVLTMRGFNRW
jgi:3-oxoacyl-[acyl-carrier protein] reductase